MKTKQLFILIFMLSCSFLFHQSSYGQITPLPYYENFDTSATLRWTSYELGTSDDGDFPWNITVHNPYSPSFSMMHTCNTGTAQANNWTVFKKPFSFDAGGKIDSIRSWITSINPPATGDTIGIYLLTGNTDPDLASTKLLLHDFRNANFQTGSWIKTSAINIPPTPGMSYIAFRYKTANNCINIFFDNMHLSGNAPTGINKIFKAGEYFTIMPNPVINKLTINNSEQFTWINIYNLIGQKVHSQSFQHAVDISFLAQGTYLLEFIDKNKKRGVHKIVKQ